MTIKRDSKWLAIQASLNSLRLGEHRDTKLDSYLIEKGLAHYIGGELFITQEGRNWLNGN